MAATWPAEFDENDPKWLPRSVHIYEIDLV